MKAKNLPFSTQDVRDVCFNCRICAELKPKFYQSQNSKLVKATRPMERLSIDFKRPRSSSSRNKYFLTVVDEYWRFPFAIPCPNVATETVNGYKMLGSAVFPCGMPEFIHSDVGSSFMSEELVNYLRSRGIASSRSTPYHSTGNSQVEKFNGIVWKSVRLTLASVKLPVCNSPARRTRTIHLIKITQASENLHNHFIDNFVYKNICRVRSFSRSV